MQHEFRVLIKDTVVIVSLLFSLFSVVTVPKAQGW